MMGGVLVTSIVTGRLITRLGRYRVFPIVGTALMTISLGLLATVGAATSVAATCLFMVVLGLGLGMVMQVLVLAAQNAVTHEHLGVATSGTTLFRSIGGSIGTAAFGAIFAAGLTANLGERLGGHPSVPLETAPAAIQALPEAARVFYLNAFTAALHPIFLDATLIGAAAFALTWFLKEVPLRGSVPPPSSATASPPAPPGSYSELDKLPGGSDGLGEHQNPRL
jgi:MFS family permease